MGLKRKTYLG